MFPRSAKSLTLSREAQTLLELPRQATPNEVIKAILRSHVDLLWNGGIGTYVKASTESNTDVGDRSNDAVRIDARELNCKVVGEGGNLGRVAARDASSLRAVAAGSTPMPSTTPRASTARTSRSISRSC